jgi:hypothetical protein
LIERALALDGPPERRCRSGHRGKTMLDSIYIAITIGFFALAMAYANACEKLRGGTDD